VAGLKWLGWLIGIGVGVSVLIALLDVLVRLFQVSPLVGGLVFILMVIAGAGLSWRFLRRKPVKPSLPQYEDKLAAAAANLAALESQLDKIRDQVTQEALRQQSATLHRSMASQEPQVVVFGVGSAGKTSLVNALMGQARGEIAPTMGTTPIGVKYRPVRVGQIKVSLTDCPGILEAGIQGTDREALARQLATRADLLLFVIDDDLRQAEFTLLQELAQLGKKILLVFNKIDRYPKPDREQIFASIRQRIAPLGIDLVPVAALPQPVELPTGEIYHPPPQIAALVAQLELIFVDQGIDLIADNVLLQTQSLTKEARSILSQQREQETQAIIDRYQWIVAGAVIANPIPLADFLATAAVHTQMVLELAQVYDCQISREDSQNLVKSLTQTLIGLGVTKTVLQIMTTALTVNPLGMVVNSTIGGITAAYLTRIAGRSFAQYFANQEQWGDGGIAAVVEAQFNLAQREELLQHFIQQAIDRVIKPLP
jgi:GTPase SAR1 family protein